MSYTDEQGRQYISNEEFEENISKPLTDYIYDAISRFYGDMYEQGYAGYPGSSQSLNIDNTFDRIARELADHACELLDEEGIGLLVLPER